MPGCGGRTDGSTDCGVYLLCVLETVLGTTSQYGRLPLEMQNTHVIHSLLLPSVSFHFVGNMDKEISKTGPVLLKIQEFIEENKNHCR